MTVSVQDFKCPICTLVVEECYGCPNGHVVCSECYPRLFRNTSVTASCPVCRIDIPKQGVRVPTLERIAAGIPRECRFSECNHIASSLQQMQRHREECAHNPALQYECTTCGIRGLTREQAVAHLQQTKCGQSPDFDATLAWNTSTEQPHLASSSLAERVSKHFEESTLAWYAAKTISAGNRHVVVRVYWHHSHFPSGVPCHGCRTGGECSNGAESRWGSCVWSENALRGEFRGLLVVAKEVRGPDAPSSTIRVRVSGSTSQDELTTVWTSLPHWKLSWKHLQRDVANTAMLIVPPQLIVRMGDLRVQAEILV